MMQFITEGFMALLKALIAIIFALGAGAFLMLAYIGIVSILEENEIPFIQLFGYLILIAFVFLMAHVII